MADIQNQQVVSDIGSEEVKLLRKSYNALLTFLGTFMDAIEAGADIAAMNAAAVAYLASVEASTTVCKQIIATQETPDRPKIS
jgi:hypothetical protein